MNNISHGVELPWEKYLSEMHEHEAPSRDELVLVKTGQPVPKKWSTLVSGIPCEDTNSH